jgi:hypothetical protein
MLCVGKAVAEDLAKQKQTGQAPPSDGEHATQGNSLSAQSLMPLCA